MASPTKIIDATGTETTNVAEVVDNKLAVTSLPHSNLVASGDIDGESAYSFIGKNNAVGTGEELVWNGGGADDYPYLSAGEVLKVKSSSANDTSAGTGARTVIIYGLDDTGAAINDTVTLNGTTAVATSISFYRINYAEVLTAGTTGWNEGNITINDNADTVPLGYIAATENVTTQANYSVATGKRYKINQLTVSVAGTKDTTVSLYIRASGGLFLLKAPVTLDNDHAVILFAFPIIVAAGGDIEVRAVSTVSGSLVSVIVEGHLEDV